MMQQLARVGAELQVISAPSLNCLDRVSIRALPYPVFMLWHACANAWSFAGLASAAALTDYPFHIAVMTHQPSCAAMAEHRVGSTETGGAGCCGGHLRRKHGRHLRVRLANVDLMLKGVHAR